MITISLIAAGLVAVAAVLTTRPAPAVRTADERGITLQTLIVTAVLVLMAVAAGVVIVAITRSASDDLEDQTSTIGAKCNEVEVYDAQLAAAVTAGTNDAGNAEGSGPGCVPVCVWEDRTSVANTHTAGVLEAAEIKFYRKTPAKKADNTTAFIKYTVDDMANNYILLDSKNLFMTAKTKTKQAIGKSTATTTPRFASGIVEIKVNPNQRGCSAYDIRGEIVT